MAHGMLIVFEGIDGSGKTTQLRRLAVVLRAAGHAVVTTREPTDGPWGRRIREMARSGEAVPPEEELRWFVEDRREHVGQLIGPALAADKIVLTDRYTLSSVAYQGARGLDGGAILAEGEAEFPLPDLVLLLAVGAEVGLDRVGARAGVAEPVFEHREFLERVVEEFAALPCPYIARIDGERDPALVHAEILDVVKARLQRI